MLKKFTTSYIIKHCQHWHLTNQSWVIIFKILYIVSFSIIFICLHSPVQIVSITERLTGPLTNANLPVKITKRPQPLRRFPKKNQQSARTCRVPYKDVCGQFPSCFTMNSINLTYKPGKCLFLFFPNLQGQLVSQRQIWIHFYI